ncbi:MAG TPA: hypothetical protein DD381_09835 [Lentisphaeria bacterium]|nr:MAG: hypothetical protein A2X47_09785 [Lentisphaerae bacterium GWF2_38_69]HBM16624.1 hypothetical protein [Lentisphaeria bacterium]
MFKAKDMNLKISLAYLLLLSLPFSVFAKPSDMPFFAKDVIWNITANIQDNISSDSNSFPNALYPDSALEKEALPGAIVSAPFEKEKEGLLTNSNYYTYMWQRDSGITMLSLLEELKSALSSGDRESIDKYGTIFINYTKFYDFASKQDSYSPGIAKFYLSGQPVFAWQNPQNDGPAFTALVLTEFAALILSQKEPIVAEGITIDKLFISKYLFNVDGKGLINQNLSYIVDHAREKTYDLWESCTGYMFFTTMIQIKALTAGAALSANFDNLSLATKYISTAEYLTYQALEHYKIFTYGKEQFKAYCEGLNFPPNLSFPIYPKYKKNDFSKYRGMSIDSSIVLGILYGDLFEYSLPSSWVYMSLKEDSFLSNKLDIILKASKEDLFPTSLEVIKSVRLLAEKAFSEKGLDPYKVNNELPRGLNLLGRYPGDIYNGTTWNDPLNQGNPWFVTSLALAHYYYTVAYEIKKIEYAEMGDRQMELIFKYIKEKQDTSGKSFIMSEQIDRNTGEQTAAHNYTWSYAQYLLTYQAYIKTREM